MGTTSDPVEPSGALGAATSEMASMPAAPHTHAKGLGALTLVTSPTFDVPQLMSLSCLRLRIVSVIPSIMYVIPVEAGPALVGGGISICFVTRCIVPALGNAVAKVTTWHTH